MKNDLTLGIRRIVVVILLLAFSTRIHCQDLVGEGSSPVATIRKANEPPPSMSESARQNWSPMGLPRLRKSVPIGQPTPIESNSFRVDPLEVTVGEEGKPQRIFEYDGVRVLKIAPKLGWERPLLSNESTLFISFQLYASLGTLVQVGGQSFLFDSGPLSNSGTIYYKGKGGAGWVSTGIHIPLEQYSEERLAALPIVTIRHDPAREQWDSFFGTRRILGNMPIASKDRSNWKIDFQGGADGILITGLVQSRENPFFEDREARGVPDAVLSNKDIRDAYAVRGRSMPLLYERIRPDRIRMAELQANKM